MWNRIQNTNFYIEFSHNLELMVTDFVSIWYNQFTNCSFLTCLKESNLGMEIDQEELVEKGTRMLHHPSDWRKVNVREEGSSLLISVSVIYGCPIRFNITLAAGSKELFFQKVTRCLLSTIIDLRASETELRHKLQEKDKEIEEYKCEGGEIALRHLRTTQFNDEMHMKSHSVYDRQFGPVSIAEILQKKLKPDPTAIVKQEPTSTVKDEPATAVKLESPVRPKQEVIVKSELQSEPQLSMVNSPRKKQKRKLNI